MKPSSAAAFSLPSPPDSSSLIFTLIAAFSCGLRGSFDFGLLATLGISTFPPSDSAHAFAAREPML